MSAEDELLHLIKQTAEQAMLGYRPHVFGHIASWDPATHRVRVVVPSMSGDDGTPVVSPWMPLGSVSVGAGFGMQIGPIGGATIENPTAGEQVVLSLFDRGQGVTAIPCMFYTAAMAPPSTVLNTALGAGELVVYNKSGSYWRMHANGDSEASTVGNHTITTKGDTSVTTTGTTMVQSKGDCTVQSTSGVVNVIASTINLTKALGDTLYGLCTDIFRELFNEHTHQVTGIERGSSEVTSQVPDQQAGTNTTTAVVRGE